VDIADVPERSFDVTVPGEPERDGKGDRFIGQLDAGAIGASITRSSRPDRFGEVEDDPW
jgi:hypothetical protein